MQFKPLSLLTPTSSVGHPKQRPEEPAPLPLYLQYQPGLASMPNMSGGAGAGDDGECAMHCFNHNHRSVSFDRHDSEF
eukprot:1139419-Pelagomonas_calceolata.AAC.2